MTMNCSHTIRELTSGIQWCTKCGAYRRWKLLLCESCGSVDCSMLWPLHTKCCGDCTHTAALVCWTRWTPCGVKRISRKPTTIRELQTQLEIADVIRAHWEDRVSASKPKKPLRIVRKTDAPS
jgi:hypothetical protein